jgi:hypothetical protein
MKRQFPFLLLSLALAAAVCAQERPRKSMTFQPGAKVPDATPAPVAKATPAPIVPGSAGPDDGPGRSAAAFFDMLGRNLVDDAYTNLTRGSKIAERPDELRTLKARTTEAIQLFGAIHGFELIETKTVGSNLLRRTYLSLGHDFPLRWRFYFYRTEEQWRLVDLRVDDRLSGMFEETEETAPASAPATGTR